MQSLFLFLVFQQTQVNQKFPEIDISLLMSDEEVNLSNRVADVAVRVKKPSQANLIFKKIR